MAKQQDQLQNQTCLTSADIEIIRKNTPSLIEMNIVDEEGVILETIRFYSNSDNLTDIDKLLNFAGNHKGGYALEIFHYNRI